MTKPDHATRRRTGLLSRRQFTAGAPRGGHGGGALGATLGAPAVAQGAVLKLGVILPRSGYLAQAGQSCFRAVEIAPGPAGRRHRGHGRDHERGLRVERRAGALARRKADQRRCPDPGRLFRLGWHLGDGPGLRAARHSPGDQYRLGAADHRAGLQGRCSATSRPARSSCATASACSTICSRRPARHPSPRCSCTPTTRSASRPRRPSTFSCRSSTSPSRCSTASATTRGRRISRSRSPRPRRTKAELLLVTTRAADAIMTVRELVKQRYEPMGVISPGSPGMYDEQFYKDARQIRGLLHHQPALVQSQERDGQARRGGVQEAVSQRPVRGPCLQCRLHLRGHADRRPGRPAAAIRRPCWRRCARPTSSSI